MNKIGTKVDNELDTQVPGDLERLCQWSCGMNEGEMREVKWRTVYTTDLKEFFKFQGHLVPVLLTVEP